MGATAPANPHSLDAPSHSPWDPLKDIAQFEQDGVLHTLQRETMAGQTAFLGSPGPRNSPPDCLKSRTKRKQTQMNKIAHTFHVSSAPDSESLGTLRCHL